MRVFPKGHERDRDGTIGGQIVAKLAKRKFQEDLTEIDIAQPSGGPLCSRQLSQAGTGICTGSDACERDGPGTCLQPKNDCLRCCETVLHSTDTSASALDDHPTSVQTLSISMVYHRLANRGNRMQGCKYSHRAESVHE